MYAQVLVEYGAKELDKMFTYIIPSNLLDKLKIGMKVVVPFANQEINGFVVDIKNEYNNEYELKEIISITDEFLVLNEELLKMGKYLKSKTLCSLITAYQTMLPSSLKVKTKTANYQKYDTYIVLDKLEDEIISYIDANKKNKKQIEILEALLIDNSILKKDISGASLNKLLELGLVKEEKQEKYRLDYGIVDNIIKPKLTDEQKSAVEKIKRKLKEEKTYLIHGVTGSGKTEIYMSLIEEVIKKNKGAIMLVPEISLTTQIVKRFYERFGNNVAIFHSSLSAGEKYDEYLKILRGDVKIVVGTRSSIFTPVKDLGIIIIDEEHSENYKQENNPRYHVLDMAKFRSNYHSIPLVLGSATPSLESMARAKKGIYELITISKRIGSSTLPKVHLVDMEKEMRKRNNIFSDLLKNKIKDRLEKKEQIILLLNRRGFSTIINCQNCGFTYKCPYCEISLTYHKTTNNLRCHYCGYMVVKSSNCPSCKNDSLNYYGLGTEKLESELKKEFPKASIVRMDTDTTKNKGSHEQIISDFQNEKYDILLGTQMISKGLDFPKVSLVGVLNADSSLNIPDFRSSERTFELLHQASGRAGRKDISGEVVIQTFNPDNYTLNNVKNNDYESFYNYEMNIRKNLKYPPYYYLVGIKIMSRDYETASLESRNVANFLKSKLNKETIILGPTTANVFKINNIYRFQIMLKFKKDPEIIRTLLELDAIYAMKKDINLEMDLSPSRI